MDNSILHHKENRWQGDKLGEQCNVGAEFNEAALRGCVSAVNIDGIGHGLEGIEGYADGKAYAQRLDEVKAGDESEVFCDEVEIFEEHQQSEIYHCVYYQRGSRPLYIRITICSDDKAADIVYQYREQHQQDVYRLTPAVEHQVDDEQPQVSPFYRDKIIYRQPQSPCLCLKRKRRTNHKLTSRGQNRAKELPLLRIAAQASIKENKQADL